MPKKYKKFLIPGQPPQAFFSILITLMHTAKFMPLSIDKHHSFFENSSIFLLRVERFPARSAQFLHIIRSAAYIFAENQ